MMDRSLGRRLQRQRLAPHHGGSCGRVQRAAARWRARSSGDREAAERLLHAFWEARGVLDAEQRSRLVKVASEVPELAATALSPAQALPGLPATWTLDSVGTEAEVLEVSRRLLQLQNLLGGSGSSSSRGQAGAAMGGRGVDGSAGGSVGGGVDVTWMVVREPALLTADYGQLMLRLLEMKTLTAGTGIDVLRVVERQPALLLSESWVSELEREQQQQQQLEGQQTLHKGQRVQAQPREGQDGQSPVSAAAAGTGRGVKEAGGGDGGGSVVSALKCDLQQDGADGVAGSSSCDAEHDSSSSNGSGSSNGGFHASRGSITAGSSNGSAGGDSVGTSSAYGDVSSSSSSGSSSGGSNDGTGSGGGSGSGGGGGDVIGSSRLEQVVQAWEFGLPSDGAAEWEERYRQLVAYRQQHKDPHCGFRDGDDVELTRWANKQRSDYKRGQLTPQRTERLQQLGFEFDQDEAEFQRWLAELRAFQAVSGHCNPSPLATGVDLYLYHWCAIQRIASRSKVLSERRTQQLTDLGFDWTGADPLS